MAIRNDLGYVYRNGYYPLARSVIQPVLRLTSSPASVTSQSSGYMIILLDSYDPSSIGYRTSMNDNSGSTAWEYDLRGRLIHETKSIRDPLGDDPLGTYHTFYAYRPDDQLKQIVLPNGEALDLDYHTQGVLDAVSSEHWDAGTITEVEYLKETQYD